MNSKLRLPLILVVVILILDQGLKFYVKTNFRLNEIHPIFGNWGFLLFTENPGMAFGFKFGGEKGKVALTLFRMLAVGGIAWYLINLAKRNAPKGLLMSFALILAGAIGNIIDSVLYGLIFGNSGGRIAEFLPLSGGYGKFLRGDVVDMFYFPIIEGRYPDWFPIMANEPFIFFRPVFNIADAAITAGVLIILIFHSKFFKNPDKAIREMENQSKQETVTPENIS
ncbi:MAG: lipoprotein signal peptidase [Bacteroidales bacterium]